MRQLVKDGAWQVPAAERPNGWQSLAVREPEFAIVIPGELDILRCDCGRSIHHFGQCKRRILLARVQLERKAAKFQSELLPVIEASGRSFGADVPLVHTALVMMAGLYTRKVRELARLTNVPENVVMQIAIRLRSVGIWKPDGAVVLGEMSGDDGDMEFWLVAMAGAGKIRLVQESGKPLKFSSIVGTGGRAESGA
jgi:hypothetical protein